MKRREVRLHSRLRTLQIPKQELVAFALDVLGRLDLTGEIGIRICGDRTMADFNRRFRGKSGPTDVLSFPDGTQLADGTVYIGDILIAGPFADKAARSAGLPFEQELKRLLLHGILHLMGYDHETDGGTMARKEKALRREWELP
jgi:probable rRNA maturation factor